MYDLPVALEEAARHAAGAEGHLPQMSIFISGLVYAQARIARRPVHAIFAIARVAGLAGPLEGQASVPIGIYRPPRSITAVPAEAGCPDALEMPRWRLTCMHRIRFGKLTLFW